MININAEITVSSCAFSGENDSLEMRALRDCNIHPPFSFRGIPFETASVAMVMQKIENDCGVFDHWVIWNMIPTAAIAQGSAIGMVGKNGHNLNGYTAPCPPFGDYYRLQVFALNKMLLLDVDNGYGELITAMDGHIIAMGFLNSQHTTKSAEALLSI